MTSDPTISTIIISDRTAGSICQTGAAICSDSRIHRVSRDRSVGSDWTIGKVLARSVSTQRCYELANS